MVENEKKKSIGKSFGNLKERTREAFKKLKDQIIKKINKKRIILKTNKGKKANNGKKKKKH